MTDTERAAPQGSSRRDFLRKSAIATGAVWAAPVILHSGPAALATGTAVGNEPSCRDGGGRLYRLKYDVGRGFAPQLDDGESFGQCGQPEGFSGTSDFLDPTGRVSVTGGGKVITFTFPADCVVSSYSAKGSNPPRGCAKRTLDPVTSSNVVTVDAGALGLENGGGRVPDLSNIGIVVCCPV